MTFPGRILIVGGSGGFGRQLAARLRSRTQEVVTLDVVAGSDVRGDLLTDELALSQCPGMDCVILAVPEATVLKLLPVLDGVLDKDTLVVDIASVKSRLAEQVNQYCLENEYLSLHPMFGPERDFAGSNMVYMPVREGPRSQALRGVLESWDLHLVECDLLKHDEITAVVQVVTHAALCAFANAVDRFELSPEQIDGFATPVFRDLEKVAQGLLSENPHLYHNIQTANVHGEQARAHLLKAMQETLQILGQTDPEPVAELFARLRKGSD